MRSTKSLALVAGALLMTGNAAAANVELITNGGFETGSPLVRNLTTIPGPGADVPEALKDGWGHNDGTVFVPGSPEISPIEGAQVLRFETTGYPGADFPTPAGDWTNTVYTGTSSDICQFIDLSAHSALIAQGNTVLTASAWVNRTGTTNNLYRLSLWPFFGPFDHLADAANTPDPDELVYGDLFSDADPTTWEELRLEITLPPGTTFVRLGISAIENVSQTTAYPEFEGHFADSVSVQLSAAPPVPTPSVLTWGMGAVLAWIGLLRLRSAGRARTSASR